MSAKTQNYDFIRGCCSFFLREKKRQQRKVAQMGNGGEQSVMLAIAHLMERLLQRCKGCWFDAPPNQRMKMLDRRAWMCSCTPVVNYKYNPNSTTLAEWQKLPMLGVAFKWVQIKAANANYPGNSSTIHMLWLDVTLSVLLWKPWCNMCFWGEPCRHYSSLSPGCSHSSCKTNYE